MVKHPFDWQRYPEGEKYLEKTLNELVKKNHQLMKLSKELEVITSTRLFDWLSHLTLPASTVTKEFLHSVGFVEEKSPIYYNPGAQFPRIVLDLHTVYEAAVVVDSIADFLMVRGLNRSIEGEALSSFRKAIISEENGVIFSVVERRGTRDIVPDDQPNAENYLKALEIWKSRDRFSFGSEEKKMHEAFEKVDEMIALVGIDQAASALLEVEREYWQSKNRAGQLQKNRQDRLGMGWSNHDHHTFRSSRNMFSSLIQLFEKIGFHCRERFYAGDEAGWGAQVMENSRAHLVLFLDVDLDPHELKIDFAHTKLPPIPRYGTVGLWCGLHGDSIFESGMHHLEAQFEFVALKDDLKHLGVDMMRAFSDFSYLKQAFTQGDLWPVDPQRVEKLVKSNILTKEQGEKFLKEGALGSHMENLQRREGYKGFNQNNVSLIIKETDPRNYL